MSANAHADGHPTHGHVAPMPILLGVFATLLLLTGVTVAVAYIDLGEFNLLIALVIATFKACLVSLFFMHLLHDSGFNRLAFFGSFFFITLFVGITLMDTGQYQDSIEWNEHVLQSAEPQ